MKYLVIDASLGGTGVRNKYEGGFIDLETLGLECKLIDKINKWLIKYSDEHYNEFADKCVVEELDLEGKEIALLIKNELNDIKLEYFSDANLTTELI